MWVELKSGDVQDGDWLLDQQVSPPVTALTSRPAALARRALNLFLVPPGTTSLEADSIHDRLSYCQW